MERTYSRKPRGVKAKRGQKPAKNEGFGGFFGPDWHTPYNQQWNLSIQRQIPWNTVVSAAYVGSKGTHLGRTYNINQPLRTDATRLLNYGFAALP